MVPTNLLTNAWDATPVGLIPVMCAQMWKTNVPDAWVRCTVLRGSVGVLVDGASIALGGAPGADGRWR